MVPDALILFHGLGVRCRGDLDPEAALAPSCSYDGTPAS
jgi:hypothetical protein